MKVSTMILMSSAEITTEVLTSVVTRKPKPTTPSSVDPVTLVVTAIRSRSTTASTTVTRSLTRKSSTRTQSSSKVTTKTRSSTRSTLPARSKSSRTTKHIPTPSTPSTTVSTSRVRTNLTTSILSTARTSVTTTVTTTSSTTPKSGPPLDRTAVTAGVSSIIAAILLITAGTMLYKFRVSLKLKFTRNQTKHDSRDEEDQPSTKPNQQNTSGGRLEHDEVELRPIPAALSKEKSDEKLPIEHVRPPLRRRSSSIYSTDSWSSVDCSEYENIWSRQVEESRIAGLDIVAWWQAVYDLQ